MLYSDFNSSYSLIIIVLVAFAEILVKLTIPFINTNENTNNLSFF